MSAAANFKLTRRFAHLTSPPTIVMMVLMLSLSLMPSISQAVDNSPSAIADRILDVGILMLDPNIPESHGAIERQRILPDIRTTESVYLPYLLRETIAKTEQWGVVRVLPRPSDTFEVQVAGKIIKSTPEYLKLQIEVTDVSGKRWFRRTYAKKETGFAYSEVQTAKNEPFYELYEQIVEDMLAYRQRISTKKLQKLRYIARIKFAQSFSPEAFSGYLKEKNGRSTLVRLPSEQEPQYQRIEDIRQREHLFVDVLDKRYQEFYNNVHTTYFDWRKFSYYELREVRRQRRRAILGGILGTVAVIGGIVAANSNTRSDRVLGNIGILAGMETIQGAISVGQQAAMHKVALEELGVSFSDAVSEQIVEIEDITVTLTGTVEEQYIQLRDLLKDIWLKETAENSHAAQQ